jgi:RES domain-containing protein
VIHVWRLTRRLHAVPPADAYSGVGAERAGGRWNQAGTPAAYAASGRALAALEYLASLDPEDLPNDLVFVGAAFDERDLELGDPPSGWDALDSRAATRYGETWLRSSSSLVLGVPSAVIKAERNYIINPASPRMKALRVVPDVEDFVFDARLLKRR